MAEAADTRLGPYLMEIKSSMRRDRLIGRILVALAILAPCVGLYTLYSELYVGGEEHPMISLPPDVNTSSVISSCRYAQALVAEWQSGLRLTAVYAHYREDDQGELATTGEIYCVFAGIRQGWLGGIARVLQVYMLNATVVLDSDTRVLTKFSIGHTDRRMWGYLNPGEWELSEEELLQVAEDHAGRHFRYAHPDTAINLQIAGTHRGEQWLQTYYSGEDRLSILINLTSGEVRLKDREENWLTVGHISE
jgi:hypothetical protein